MRRCPIDNSTCYSAGCFENSKGGACIDREFGIMPFWKWKQQEYAKDQAAATPRSKEDYYRDYGKYCNKVRRQNEHSRSKSSGA